MNYYIIVPSAASFCAKSNGKYIDSVLVICAPSMTALVSVILLAYRFIGQNEKSRVQMFYKHLFLSAIFPLIGNILYTISYQWRAVSLAFISRLLIGLSSPDTINKQFVMSNSDSSELPNDVASIRKSHILGMIIGLLVGSLSRIEEIEVELYGHWFNIGFESLPGYIMFFAWIVQLLLLLISPYPKNLATTDEAMISNTDLQIDLTPSPSDQEDASQTRSQTRSIQNAHRRTYTDQSKLDYYMKRLERNTSDSSCNTEDQKESGKKHAQSRLKSRPKDASVPETLNESIKVILHEYALPTTMVLVLFCNLSIEMVMSSFIIVTHRYFGWSGPNAGLFLTALGLLIIPLNIAASFWSRRIYGERLVIKKSLFAILIALVMMINYQSLYTLLCEIRHLLKQFFTVEKETSKNYDWYFGVYQYCIGTFSIFVSVTVLECSSLNLMSKVSNEKSNLLTLNCNFLLPFVECFGRVVGGAIVFLVGVSHRLIYADIVNSIALFWIVMTIFCRYLVKKYYFFLYGNN